MGASAGVPQSFEALVAALPPDPGMAFIFVCHLSPDRPSHLTELLARRTPMPVIRVEGAIQVVANHVYVVAPRCVLRLVDGMLLSAEFQPDVPAERRYVVDTLFLSLAQEKGARAVGIILSGAGEDGTRGCAAIRKVGGLTLAQSLETAAFDGMPRHAAEAGVVDLLLPIADMPPVLLDWADRKHGDSGALDAARLDVILKAVRARTGRDFSEYRSSTLRRRIQRRAALSDSDGMDDYLQLVQAEGTEAATLARDLLVRVTSFFRDPEAFATLREEVLPSLLAAHEPGSPLRVWVPGCATGEEAYSLAILFHEALESLGAPARLEVFATDADPDAIAVARLGIFSASIAAVVPERLARYFTAEGRFFRIDKRVRESVVFAVQDVLQDPPFSRLHLVSCRNLLMYLEPEAQRRVLAIFHFSLREGGFLLLGTAESAEGTNHFEAVNKKWRLYRRRHGPGTLPANREGGRSIVPIAGLARTIAAPRATQLAQVAGHALLGTLVPPTALVTAQGEVIYFHGPIGRYLNMPPGEPTRNLLGMMPEPMSARVRRALLSVGEGGAAPIVVGDLRVGDDPDSVVVQLTVRRTPPRPGGEPWIAVTFEEVPTLPPVPSGTSPGAPREPSPDDPLVHQLEVELRVIREDLRSTLGEFQDANLALTLSNEEITSMNEEIQSANEELDTSREELQSINEELVTLNSELQGNVDALQLANDDLANLLASTEIATVCLDRELRIRRYTPSTQSLLSLIPTDVGRPIVDIARRFSDPKFDLDAAQVIDSLGPVEREVAADDGRFFIRRLLPYRTHDDRIDGLVLSFVDISELSRGRGEAATRAELLAVVLELTEITQRGDDPGSWWSTIARRVGQALGCHRTSIFEAVAGTDHFILRAGHGWAPEDIGKVTLTAELIAPAGRGLLSARVPVPGAPAPVEFISVPIAGPERPFGLLAIDHCDGAHSLGEVETRFLQSVSNVLSHGIRRVDSDLVTAARLQAAAQIDALFALRDVGLAILNAEGDFTRTSTGLERMLGRDAAELYGHPLASFAHVGDQGKLLEGLDALRQGEALSLRTRLRFGGPGDAVLWGQVTLTLVPGGPSGGDVLLLLEDVTSSVELEREFVDQPLRLRKHLGRELHDGLGQLLVGIGMLGRSLELTLRSAGSPSVDVSSEINRHLSDAQARLRTLATNLLPAEVDERTLSDALLRLTDDVRSLTGVESRLEWTEPKRPLQPTVAAEVFRIAQESVNNAVRHARAKKIVVSFTQDGEQNVLTVRDDGIGTGSRQDAGLGLRVMRYRAGVIGAELEMGPAAGGGTQVTCRFADSEDAV